MTKNVIKKALMTQFTSKTPRSDKFNFHILRIVWEQESK